LESGLRDAESDVGAGVLETFALFCGRADHPLGTVKMLSAHSVHILEEKEIRTEIRKYTTKLWTVCFLLMALMMVFYAITRLAYVHLRAMENTYDVAKPIVR
jgi:hypothetical protein